MRLLTLRLDRQLVSRQRFATPREVVAWFGAMQAQDYLAALWALGLRTPRATEASIDAAITDGSVVRLHGFRGTWQYVARDDVRWMLGLVGDRVIASTASRFRELELDHKTLRRCVELFRRALEGGQQFTRGEMADALARGRIPAVPGRLLHILGYAELDGVICSGGRRGKQATFALLDERVPPRPAMDREPALTQLAMRFFQSRGPATDRDFSWWTGLTLSESRRAVELAGAGLDSARVDGKVCWFVEGAVAAGRRSVAHLLPAFDEYLVGYQDRAALIEPQHSRKVNNGGGILNPALLMDGRVVGTWRRTLSPHTVTIALRPFTKPTGAEREALVVAAGRYAEFLGLEARLLR